MKKNSIWIIIAVAVAIVAAITTLVLFRKQIADFFSSLKAKSHKADSSDFTPEEFEDFADI